MSLKLLLGDFKWVEETSQFNEDSMKSYNEDSHIGYFLEVDFQYPDELDELLKDLPVLPERKEIGIHIKIYTHKKFKTSIKSWMSI